MCGIGNIVFVSGVGGDGGSSKYDVIMVDSLEKDRSYCVRFRLSH